MEKIVNKAMDDLILTIKNSNDYKKCMEIKEKLKNSQDVNGLVDEIKKYQKEYVRTNDENILKMLNVKKRKLNEIPIYNSYIYYLEKVNDMIEIVKEELNNYFNNLVN